MRYLSRAVRLAVAVGLGGASFVGVSSAASAVATCDGLAATVAGVTGTSGNDVIVGTAAGEHINGNGGNDVICPGGGNDTVDGGTGKDRVVFEGATAAVTANLQTGVATGQGNDQISNVEDLTGGPLGDHLTGNSKNNTLNGAMGNDVLKGNGGVDTVSFANTSTAVTVDLQAGTAIGQGSDQLTGFVNVIGSNGNDKLLGDAAANTLNGGLGLDDCIGRAGSDIAVNCELGTFSPAGNTFDQYRFSLQPGQPIYVQSLAYAPTSGAITRTLTDPVATLAGPTNGNYDTDIVTQRSGVHVVMLAGTATNTGGTHRFHIWIPQPQTGGITPDASKRVAIDQPGKQARFTFSGSAGETVSLTLTPVVGHGWSDGNCYGYEQGMRLWAPDGTSVAGSCLRPGGLIVADLPSQSGQYVVTIDLEGANTGQADLLLHKPGIQQGSLTPDAPKRVVLDEAGRRARFTFSGSAGETVSLTLTPVVGHGWSDGNCYGYEQGMRLWAPDGTSVAGSCLRPGGLIVADLPSQSGQYVVTIDLEGANTGQADLLLHKPGIQQGSLTPDAPKRVVLDEAGRRARFTFSGSAGETVSLTLTPVVGHGWSDGNCYGYEQGMRLWAPDGTSVAGSCLRPGGLIVADLPSQSGQYVVTIDLEGANTGQADLLLHKG